MITTTVELYQRLAPAYDIIYGALLQPGRDLAMTRLAPRAGQRILEIGVGTGFALRHYPARCTVVAIDLSASMIARAQRRLRRHRLEHVALCRMDAGALAFADQSFDAVAADSKALSAVQGLVPADSLRFGDRRALWRRRRPDLV